MYNGFDKAAKGGMDMSCYAMPAFGHEMHGDKVHGDIPVKVLCSSIFPSNVSCETISAFTIRSRFCNMPRGVCDDTARFAACIWEHPMCGRDAADRR